MSGGGDGAHRSWRATGGGGGRRDDTFRRPAAGTGPAVARRCARSSRCRRRGSPTGGRLTARTTTPLRELLDRPASWTAALRVRSTPPRRSALNSTRLPTLSCFSPRPGGIAVFHAEVISKHAVVFTLVPSAWIAENLVALWRYGRLSSFHTCWRVRKRWWARGDRLMCLNAVDTTDYARYRTVIEGCCAAANEFECFLIEVEQLAGLGLRDGAVPPGDLAGKFCR